MSKLFPNKAPRLHGLGAQFDAGQIAARRQNEDACRADFLFAMDAAHILVTDWEQEFIERFVARANARRGDAHPFEFSPRQRNKIDEMQKKYRNELGL